jgi:outer membrane protein
MRLLFFSLLLLAGQASHAEQPLTWDEVGKLARERNASLASAEKSKQASSASRKSAYGGYLPKLSLNADRTRSKTEVSSVETRKTDLKYGATASLNLFNGFSTSASVARAQAVESETAASFDLTSATLRRDLRVAFFNIYVLQERLRLNEKDLKRVQQNQKLVELKYNAGSEARWNLKKTRAELDRANYDVASSKAQLENAREQLARLLNTDSLPNRPVAAPDKGILETAPASPERSIASHPELQKAKFASERAAQDIRTARSGYFPSIDLSATRSFNDSRPDTTASSKTNSLTFAITADWNIFNGATDYYKVQEASLNHEAAEIDQAETERRLVAELRTKGTNFRNALGLLPVSRAVREAGEERERTVSEQYRSGLKTYIDWEQAESQLLSAEQAEIKALGDSLSAFAELELAQGLTMEQP